ncbi:karyopherin beta [Tulasnella sp. 330]|nr:karyopherin beta [Tulasnella sp. 330]KAG8872333.1 karyopherin beta [Tulasnella sp. 332]KAG8877653.1 karyopherin beta [Tulasnella sp. 331]
MNANELLANSLSPDAATRQNATTQLENAARQDYSAYVSHLTNTLADESSPAHIRTAAGIAVKNSLSSRDFTRQNEYTQRWLSQSDVRAAVKQQLLQTLASPQVKIALDAGQVISSIANIELPVGQWPELVQTLLGFVSQTANVTLKVATLQTIGYICESVKPEVLEAQSNEILTAVVQGARQDETNRDVKLAALRALYNSLEFVRENMENEGERNYLMQVVCEATQFPATEVQVAAFECLVRIMGLYYDKMGFYMERALFGLTSLGMNNEEEAVALQAIEFWSTVCEEEIDLAVEAAEAAEEYGEPPARESKYFAKTALPEILPIILQLLTRQEEDAEEDEWNISMAAGTCLSLLARAVGDIIVPPVIPFIESNIKAQDWHHREAAVMAFGSILDGPDPTALETLVNQALPILLPMMQDENINVKDTTAWTLGCICDLMATSLKSDQQLHNLVGALVNGIEDKPRISANCSWSLMNLVDQLHGYSEDGVSPQTGPLSAYYQNIVAALMRATEKPTNEANYRTSAYEALAAYVTQAPIDSLQAVSAITLAILDRQEQLLAMQSELLGVDDRTNWNELQSNFCSIIISVIRKLGGDIKPLTDRIMIDALNLIKSSGKQSTTLEDGFLVVGTMASAIEQDFKAYVNPFLDPLLHALQTQEDSQLCTVAVGVIGDICRALGDSTEAYSQGFMGALLQTLQSTTLNRTVKISVLACFGDIALAIGAKFEPYLEHTMGVLKIAGELTADDSDYDLIDYVQSLREGIVEAYVGIITALKSGGKGHAIKPYVPSIMELLQRSLTDEERTETLVKLSVGLIGDLADAFRAGELRDSLMQEWILNALKIKGRGYSADTKKTLKWAKEMIKVATQTQG